MKVSLILAILFFTSTSFGVAKVGEIAPDFEEKDHSGETRRLNDFKGQWVVLEWFNEGCPYVKKHYGSGNMQALQKKYTDKKVAWLTVATSAEGKQGYVDPAKAKEQIERAQMASTALLLDADGTMGRAYGAKTTPHMFVINPEGKIVYAGAIDSNDSANPETIKTSENYVVAVLDAALAGKEVKTSSTRPYGCSVKYK